MDREQLAFTSGGQRVAGWWYPPPGAGDGAREAPAVVMAHGFAMTRACGLDVYARAFRDAGCGVLVFDHRGFGDSGGTPQVLDLAAQRADWRAAVDWARNLPAVDPDRVAVWGTSFSGGHVLHTAARDHRLAAAVAQVPYVDGPASLGIGGPRGSAAPDRAGRPTRGGPSRARWVAHGAGLLVAATRDAWRGRRGRDPLLVPVAGELGSGAVIAGPGAERGIRVLVPDGVPWRNEVAPRVVLQMLRDRPGHHADEVRCPLLVAVCDRDRVTPPWAAVAAAERAPRGEVRHYDADHFEAYVPPLQDAMLADQVAFLRSHLGLGHA